VIPQADSRFTGDWQMTAPAIQLDEFEQEMATTRRLLERVPDDKGPWKPHEKSFPLGHLAQLVAWMPGWISRTLREPHIDLATGEGYSFQPTAKLLSDFDKNVAAARDALASVTGAALDENWELRHGDNVLMTSKRGPTVRMHLRHLIHHRGQLSVYLRELDVPIPSIYGPSADERW
jgi:uncharacterized damage-inducible protein DinB